LSLEQTDAIVLRIHPWSETSLVVNLYTRDFGKVGAVAKGARRGKSPFEAALDLLAICRVVFVSKASDVLDTLTEAKLQRRFRAGQRDLLRLYAGYYMAELLDRFTARGDKQPELYDIAVDTLQALEDSSLAVGAIVLRFELQLLRCVGQLPSWERCGQCGREMEAELNASDGVVIGLMAGGVLCHSCQAGARMMIRVPVAVWRWLRVYSSSDWRAMELNEYPALGRASLRRTVEKYLTLVLDRQLNLHHYLEELGR
jgi:DNA repair protein RecO (recombination protein O)